MERSQLRKDNMPNIAVLGSGGGLRAMIALQGTLVELKKQGLLDAVVYLCGVSGSTWCMSTLYQEKDCTEKVQDLEEGLCDTLSKPPHDIQEEFTIATQAAEDELFSLIDVWTSFFVYKTLKQYDETKLSEHEDTSTSGTNPYPIYAAIEANKLGKGTWFEFTHHESGFPSLGAFVCTKDLGSKFKDGNLNEKREEKSICYLQGLWGSALGSMAANKKYLIDLIKEKFKRLRGEQQNAVCEAGTACTCVHCRGAHHLLELHVHATTGEDCEGVFGQLKEALEGEKSKNSYKKCCEVHETWGSMTWEERMAECAKLVRIFEMELGGEAQSTGLTNHKFIHLIDAGIAINSAYPLVLHPKRKVKLILFFDFSDGDPFETIKKTAKYCEANYIPFPKIDPEKLKDTDTPSSCYIFKGKDVPTVMHFPLFNKENCPGEIEDFRDRFTTFTSSYPEDDVKQLLKRAKMNVSNNKERIRKEIQQIVSSSHEGQKICVWL